MCFCGHCFLPVINIYIISLYFNKFKSFQPPPECLRCQLRSRAVKRAYFTLISTAMHAHPVRRRTAPVSYIRRHAPCGALYGYCIKIYKFLFYQALPHLIYSLHRVNKMFGLQSERSGASDNANRERQLAAGALYGYCIKTYKLFFLSNFTAPNAKFMPRRVDKMFGLQSERNGVSDNANRLRRHSAG